MSNFYRRYVWPHLLDWAMHHPRIVPYRAPTLAPATGRVLEIGFGTGANLPHYAPSVRELEIVEPDAALNEHAARRLAASDRLVTIHSLCAERLPFEADRFDTVVSTFTLCSIPDVSAALAEVRRVLRPGGQFLFLEHGLAPDLEVARWQRRLTPLQKRLGGGCHLDRPVRALLVSAGLSIDASRSREHYVRGLPRVLGWFSHGVAHKERDT